MVGVGDLYPKACLSDEDAVSVPVGSSEGTFKMHNGR